MTLHALRLKIGDAAFFRLLREWVRDERAAATSRSRSSSRSPRRSRASTSTPFFQEWLFTPAKPASLGGDVAARSAPQSAAPARVRKR